MDNKGWQTGGDKEIWRQAAMNEERQAEIMRWFGRKPAVLRYARKCAALIEEVGNYNSVPFEERAPGLTVRESLMVRNTVFIIMTKERPA